MATELNNNISQMFDQLENFVSTKTVVGEPITAGESTLIPLVDVSFGMGGGSTGDAGAEKGKNGEKSMSGLGAKIKPSAVLVITDGNVQLVNIKHQDSVNKLIDMIPSITSKFDFGAMFGKKKGDSNIEDTDM
ncbi:MAG: GerW family sporulation protein [Defluviitaleaceae bacterium]|nr:GerW family sporulation protein [Defluviitaleaceae bacterium]